ncbi:MAG: flagellar basal body-associated FliL family protein [Deltaproteobacteria bacterium]|nr:flagellar basal body-associated FliL family protein [Deltaproteobacteria bacterium]MBW2468233.1 flagellar basal body-associated FliL family protein [Deltaproteobacteria bacterium]MBW2486387.1 flagellar basal body-associated FliL family protein [Deltaproteobacteria bacterium]MBW2518143.1 flagellar basal body-associated FliL family protein [Deltaproteobacteria bacterium]
MSNKVMFLVIAVMLVVTIGLAAGFFMMWGKLSEINTQAPPTANMDINQSQMAQLGPLFPLKTFIVNLADEERNRYLRVTMDLELVAPTDTEKLNQRLPQVRDRILMILPSKRFDEIASVEGKTALRDEIINKLNSLFPRTVITNIFFTEFVVQ